MPWPALSITASAAVVDEVGIVAEPAAHGVGTGAAVEEIVAGIAEQRVGQTIAEALQVGSALQHQGLDIRRQPIIDGGENSIVTLAGVLDHRIAGVVDKIGIIAEPAAHGIGAGAAVEEIVAGIAEERVGQTVAEALKVRAALEHESLHVGCSP